MIIGILQNTPLWVWVVLLGLMALGLPQTRSRKVSRLLVLLVPAIMVPLSLYAVIASFGVSTAGLSAWVAGVAAAVAVNGLVFLSPKGVHYSVEDQAYELPGSWVPLALMLTIFCARFAVGVSTPLSASIVSTVGFVGGVSVILGACSGLFLSRSMRILSVQRRAAA